MSRIRFESGKPRKRIKFLGTPNFKVVEQWGARSTFPRKENIKQGIFLVTRSQYD